MKRLFVIAVTGLLFAGPVFSQTIQCGPDITQVAAWTAPGSAYIVDYLSCGQSVSAVQLERGFWKIQMGDKLAYVDAKYVRTETARPHGEPERTATKAERSRSLRATPYQRFEIFGNYSYAYPSRDMSRSHGWSAGATVNINSFLGIEFEASQLRAEDVYLSVVKYKTLSFVSGPKVSYRKGPLVAYSHALFGARRFDIDVPEYNLSASTRKFVPVLGGGIDWAPNKRFKIRILQVDYFPWSDDGAHLNNLRFSIGPAVMFGK